MEISAIHELSDQKPAESVSVHLKAKSVFRPWVWLGEEKVIVRDDSYHVFTNNGTLVGSLYIDMRQIHQETFYDSSHFGEEFLRLINSLSSQIFFPRK